MKTEYKALLASVGTSLGIAAVSSAIVHAIVLKLDSPVLSALLTSLYMVGLIYTIARLTPAQQVDNSHTVDKKLNDLEEAIVEAKKNKVPVNVSCAYCRLSQPVLCSLAETNSFVCVECKKRTQLYLQLHPVQTTEPISNLTITDSEIIDEVGDANVTV